MVTTSSMSHLFSVVTQELIKLYSRSLKVEPVEVAIILKDGNAHVLISGKLFESIKIKNLHKITVSSISKQPYLHFNDETKPTT